MGVLVMTSPCLLLLQVGKVEPDTQSLLNGHKAQVLTLAFSPFASNLLATGCPPPLAAVAAIFSAT